MKKYNLVVIGGGLSGIAAAEAINTNTNAHTVDISAVEAKIIANGGEIH